MKTMRSTHGYSLRPTVGAVQGVGKAARDETDKLGWASLIYRSGVSQMGWSFGGPEVEFEFEGVPARVHPDGNNIAWCCPDCGHPLIFVYRIGRAGSSLDNPTQCIGCDSRFYIEPPFGQRQ
jgi:hypothetical protein